MKRRDIIIIAVLVNAGILLVLFTTALRTDKKKEDKSIVSESSLADLSLPNKAGEMPLTTEELLNEYIASTTSESELVEIPVTAPQIPSSFGQNVPGQNPVVASPQTPVQPTPFESNISSLPMQTQIAAPTLAPTLAPAPVVKDEVVEVTVKKGDYLEKIAKANNSSVNAIMSASNLSSTQLKIGQVLKVPVGKAKEVKKEIASTDGDFYIVKEGDSPWGIAQKCHVKLDDLLKLNNIDDQKAKHLRPGDKLRIR